MVYSMIDRFITYASNKKGANVYFREEWECYYFSLLGKCFGMLNDTRFTLKGYPEENESLREMYSDITPGYYTNKVHWNTIKLPTNQVSVSDIEKMIDVSYTLVFNKLTKKEKQSIEKQEVTL